MGQQFCEAIWYVSEPGEEISQQQIASAIDILISREKLSFHSALAKVTASQMGCLNALAVIGGKAPTSKEFLVSLFMWLYDVVCFDEISGVSFDQKDGVNIMKGYMESGEFSRGKESIRADVLVSECMPTFRLKTER